jgi:hypothetical protein
MSANRLSRKDVGSRKCGVPLQTTAPARAEVLTKAAQVRDGGYHRHGFVTGGDMPATVASERTARRFDAARIGPYPACVMLLGIVIERNPAGGSARAAGLRDHL